MPNLSIIWLFVAVSLIACKSHPQEVETSSNTQTQTSVNYSPFSSVIHGKVKEVIDLRDQYSDDHPCAKAPCEAKVEVLGIQQKGQNYHGQFKPGDEITVHFDFTLSPTTSELFPNLNSSYPGLKVGESFEAQLIEREGGNNPIRVTKYILLE